MSEKKTSKEAIKDLFRDMDVEGQHEEELVAAMGKAAVEKYNACVRSACAIIEMIKERGLNPSNSGRWVRHTMEAWAVEYAPVLLSIISMAPFTEMFTEEEGGECEEGEVP